MEQGMMVKQTNLSFYGVSEFLSRQKLSFPFTFLFLCDKLLLKRYKFIDIMNITKVNIVLLDRI